MHVPSTPETSQVVGGVPLLLLVELELLLLVVVPLLLVLELLVLLLVLLVLELLLEELLLPVGVQHSMLAAPAQ